MSADITVHREALFATNNCNQSGSAICQLLLHALESFNAMDCRDAYNTYYDGMECAR